MEEKAHTFHFEVGGAARLWGAQPRLYPSDRGTPDPATLVSLVRPDNVHLCRTRLCLVENTHNFHGGAVVPVENLRAIRQLCTERGVPVHIDGARIWNASAATGIALAEYASLCDTMSVCLSKGLGAPVGSALAGSSEGGPSLLSTRYFSRRSVTSPLALSPCLSQ